MKSANVSGITTMTILFLLCGGLGYAAFGDGTPGNILTGFGFYEPYWLIALGNVFIVIHMVGAYQVRPFHLFINFNLSLYINVYIGKYLF